MGNKGAKTKEIVEDNFNLMPEHKVVFIGNDSVGKTAIINQYFDSPYPLKTVPTIGYRIHSKVVDVPGGGENGKP